MEPGDLLRTSLRKGEFFGAITPTLDAPHWREAPHLMADSVVIAPQVECAVIGVLLLTKVLCSTGLAHRRESPWPGGTPRSIS